MNKITIGLFQFTNVESAGVFFLLMVISLIIVMCSNRTKLWQCALSGTIVYSILSFIFIAGSNHHPVKLWQFFAAMALISAHLVWLPVGIVALYCTRWRWRNLILIMAVAAVALFTVLGIAQEAANAQRKCDALERQIKAIDLNTKYNDSLLEHRLQWYERRIEELETGTGKMDEELIRGSEYHGMFIELGKLE
jgi:hypothetical protein